MVSVVLIVAERLPPYGVLRINWGAPADVLSRSTSMHPNRCRDCLRPWRLPDTAFSAKR
jgi:hypothetical protein